MVALQISSMKQFMNHLLVLDTFQSFLLEEGTLSVANTFTIDGRINREFYEGDAEKQELPYDFRPWNEVKGICFDLIKGKRTPLFFRFVLQLKPDQMQKLLEKNGWVGESSAVKAFLLNIRYDGSKAVITTGVSYGTFLLTKEPDTIWDKATQDFLTKKGIEFDVL